MASKPRCPGYRAISPSVCESAEVQEASAPEQIEVENEQLLNAEEKKKEEAAPVPEPRDDARRPRVGRRPVLPTKAGIEEHHPLYLNYRDWCEHCVSGTPGLAQHNVEPAVRERDSARHYVQVTPS